MNHSILTAELGFTKTAPDAWHYTGFGSGWRYDGVLVRRSTDWAFIGQRYQGDKVETFGMQGTLQECIQDYADCRTYHRTYRDLH